jgi:hypothetical protein
MAILSGLPKKKVVFLLFGIQLVQRNPSVGNPPELG